MAVLIEVGPKKKAKKKQNIFTKLQKKHILTDFGLRKLQKSAFGLTLGYKQPKKTDELCESKNAVFLYDTT